MIRDFSATPKQQNKKSVIFMSAFFVAGAILFGISLFINNYRGVVGLVALLLFTTGVFVYIKFVSVVFHYDIIAEGQDEPIFVIRQTVGKRNITLVRIAFREIEKIERETLSERRAHKTKSRVNAYSYCPTLMPDVSYRIYFKNAYESGEITVEGSEEFIEMLRSAALFAKENYTDMD
jgi:hypothetical protein